MRFQRMAYCVMLIIGALSLTCYGQENLLVNPGVEVDATGQVPGWRLHSRKAFTFDRDVKHGGESSLVAERKPGEEPFGVMQEIEFAKPDKSPVLFGGWSKAENVVSDYDYNVYLDIFHEDGSNTWAITSAWNSGTHDWEKTFRCYWPQKPIAKIQFFVLFRRDVHGKAWFDDFELYRDVPDAQLGEYSFQTLAPLSENGVFFDGKFFRKDVEYVASLKDASGKELAQTSGKGDRIRWQAPLAEKPAKLDLSAEAAGKRRTYELTVSLKTPLPENPIKSGYRIWTADSMTNVSPATYPKMDAPQSAFVELAKAEYESFQLLVSAGPQAIKSVNVTLPELKDREGTAFSGDLKWERVGYIPRRRPYSRHPDGYGDGEFWLPDPLLPAREFVVHGNATQGVWVTIQAKRDCRAGQYSGNIEVVVDGEKTNVPLTVRVFDFALPTTFSYPTAFCIMDGWLFDAYPDGDLNARRRQAWDMMLDHRLNPDDISRTEPPRIEDLLYARERGMNRFNIMNMVPKPKGKRLWVCYAPQEAYTPELFEEFKSRLDPYVAELRKHDLTKYAYVYGFDERGEGYNPIMEKVHKLVKERYPDVAFFTTSMMYKQLKENPDRTDCYANDWYCPLTSVYDDELSAKLRAKGHQVWWYTCCGPRHPHANFSSIEYPFIEGRVIAWLSYQHRVDGFLFWHVNLWRGPYRFDESVCFQPGFESSAVAGMVGDGQFLYPGVAGPVPSIRLANIRDGSEDYDYLSLSGEYGRELCSEIATTMTDFTREPSRVRQIRRRLGEWLSKKE